jgi:outer membrane immunogenic protein
VTDDDTRFKDRRQIAVWWYTLNSWGMEMRTGSRRIRLLLGVMACSGAMIVSAQSADLSARQPAIPAAYTPQAVNWTGFYIGAHLGGAWGDVDWTDPVSGLRNNLSNAGVLGGAQLGFNYQFDSLVFGFEGDFSGASLSTSGTDAAGFVHSTSTYWTSTVTGRLGYAIDRALFFVKGGVAFADERDTLTSPLDVFSGTSTTQVGWTAGGGVEYAMDRNWSADIEYDYLGFASQSVPAANGGAPGSVGLNIQRVVAAINYRF